MPWARASKAEHETAVRTVKLTAKQRALLRSEIARRRLEAVQAADKARWAKALNGNRRPNP
jgi:hypothetical protein